MINKINDLLKKEEEYNTSLNSFSDNDITKIENTIIDIIMKSGQDSDIDIIINSNKVIYNDYDDYYRNLNYKLKSIGWENDAFYLHLMAGYKYVRFSVRSCDRIVLIKSFNEIINNKKVREIINKGVLEKINK